MERGPGAAAGLFTSDVQSASDLQIWEPPKGRRSGELGDPREPGPRSLPPAGDPAAPSKTLKRHNANSFALWPPRPLPWSRGREQTELAPHFLRAFHPVPFSPPHTESLAWLHPSWGGMPLVGWDAPGMVGCPQYAATHLWSPGKSQFPILQGHLQLPQVSEQDTAPASGPGWQKASSQSSGQEHELERDFQREKKSP